MTLKDTVTHYVKSPYSELFWSECGNVRTRITPNTVTFYELTGPILDQINVLLSDAARHIDNDVFLLIL